MFSVLLLGLQHRIFDVEIMKHIGHCIALPLSTDTLPCTSCSAWLPAATAVLLLLMGTCALSRLACKLSPGLHDVCKDFQHGSSQVSGFMGCFIANLLMSASLHSSNGCLYFQALLQHGSLLLGLQQSVLQ